MKMSKLPIAWVLAVASASGAWAQSPGHDHAGELPARAVTSPDATPLVTGVVQKVDREARKVTLRHGPIPNLEMPEMTMVFQVADPGMLDRLEISATVRFKADRINGQLTLTFVEPTS